jgi:hypothetical protein
MANGECVACHAQATGELASLWATPASYAVEMSRARGWAASAQNRGVFSRDGRAYWRLVKIAWRGRLKRDCGYTGRVGDDTIYGALSIAQSGVNDIDMGSWTLM